MSTMKIIGIFGLIAVVPGLLGLLRLYFKFGDSAWNTLKRGFRLGLSFKLGTAVLAIACAGLFGLCYQAASGGEAVAIISLNYPDASKGQNANGTRFNMSEILCQEVLERAIRKGAFENVTVEDLSDCLSVTPTVQGDSTSEDAYHISTEYAVIYRKNEKTAHLDAKNVVRVVANAYKEFYIDKYTDSFVALDIQIDPEADFSGLDYLDIATYLENQTNVISNYMYALGDENPGFISSAGESFYELAAQIRDIRSVQINDNLKAYLLQNGISKDRDKYIGRLTYNNTLSGFEREKDTASYDIRNEAIEMYSEEMTRVVLVPTWDEAGEYYMGRTKVGIDTLSVEAEAYSQQAAATQKEIETNDETIRAMEQNGTDGIDEKAEMMIADISSSIEQIADKAQKAGREYSEAKLNSLMSGTVIEDSFLREVIPVAVFVILFYMALNVFVGSFRKKTSDRMR